MASICTKQRSVVKILREFIFMTAVVPRIRPIIAAVNVTGLHLSSELTVLLDVLANKKLS